MRVVGEVLMGKKPESEKLDIAQSGEDIGDPPPLEDEQDAEKRQKGQGLEIVTPKQMITRFQILLAQLKAGNTVKSLKMK